MSTVTTATDLSTAEEIRRQIGHKAFYMMGATHLAGDANSLHFRIKGSPVANYIKVTLNRAADDYTVEFGKIRGINYKPVKEVEGVYIDQLHEVIEQTTKLYLSLGTCGK